MAGTSYPGLFQDSSGQVRFGGSIVFTSDSNQPVPQNPAVSGSLSDTGAWVSGTAKIVSTTRAVTVAVELVGDATNNIATCTVAISPDNSTFTTIGTPSLAAAINNTGAVTLLTNVPLPTGWAIKLTFSHFTVAASKYW